MSYIEWRFVAVTSANRCLNVTDNISIKTAINA